MAKDKRIEKVVEEEQVKQEKVVVKEKSSNIIYDSNKILAKEQ